MEPADAHTSSAPAEDAAFYTEFDAFLKVAIREYYDVGWTRRRGNFIALLIASGQTAIAMAKDSVMDGTGTKKVAMGAAAAIALRVGLKYALGGPLGMVLTVAAAASMVTFILKNQKDISAKVVRYRSLITDVRAEYEKVHNDWRSGKMAAADRNLMIDGLLKRFLERADQD